MTIMIAKKIQNIFNRSKEQRTLQEFYKDLLAWNGESTLCWILTGLMVGISGIFIMIPYQEVAADIKEMCGFIFTFIAFGVISYLQPYIRFNEGGKMISIYQKLKYIPVSKREIRLYCLQKLLIFCIRMFLVLFVLQIFFAIVFFKEIVWGNIWYPVVFGGLIPFGLGAICIWSTL